jgi:hypothetical protein
MGESAWTLGDADLAGSDCVIAQLVFVVILSVLDFRRSFSDSGELIFGKGPRAPIVVSSIVRAMTRMPLSDGPDSGADGLALHVLHGGHRRGQPGRGLADEPGHEVGCPYRSLVSVMRSLARRTQRIGPPWRTKRCGMMRGDISVVTVASR